ncbi:MAG: IS110 family transposase [Bacteroidetes bacterium]|nr:MAG: IS110 family transposase [Bacteroidota bacterium]
MEQLISCGLDVHKETIFCALYQEGQKSEVMQYPAFTSDLKQMAQFLKDHGVNRVAMESTGIYWVPVWNVLEKEGFELMLVNPYLIKQMPGRKSDVKDSQWIAQLLYKGMLKGSLIPTHRIRELRCYSREYVKIQRYLTRVTNKMERVLETANIRICSLVSKNNSKTVIDIIRAVVEGKTEIEDLLPLVHGRIKNAKGEEVKKSLEGFIQPEHQFILGLSMQQYELYTKQSEELTMKMKALCDTYYKEEMTLLESIPGIKQQASMQIIAETGADMSQFENSSKITSWVGFRPRNDESAGKIKSKAITKGNTYLRTIMVQVAWAASRTKGSHCKEKYEQLAARKSPKKALIAIARKQLSVVWNVLSKKQVYDPTKQPVVSSDRLEKKMKYHQKQLDKLQKTKAN